MAPVVHGPTPEAATSLVLPNDVPRRRAHPYQPDPTNAAPVPSLPPRSPPAPPVSLLSPLPPCWERSCPSSRASMCGRAGQSLLPHALEGEGGERNGGGDSDKWALVFFEKSVCCDRTATSAIRTLNHFQQCCGGRGLFGIKNLE